MTEHALNLLTLTLVVILTIGSCTKSTENKSQTDAGSDSGDGTDSGPSTDSDTSDGGLNGDAVVSLEQGAIAGYFSGSTRVFKAIPYAAPPIGQARWKAPGPAVPWQGIRDATLPGAPCSQINIISNFFLGDEDCLTLNIWTPWPLPEEPLPVMVWFHGGAFTMGTASEPIFDGQGLSERGDVIVVTLNYRLGALGFLSHPALAEEDPAHPASGNYGLLDQKAALQWVQQNIDKFGGDKHQITIFGESAGAFSVSMHLLSTQSSGLFHRAIIESGPRGMFPITARASAEARGETFAGSLGCTDAPQVLECLRGKTAEQIVTVNEETESYPGGLYYQGEGAGWEPSIDDFFITPEALSTGVAQVVPVLLGTNTDEGTMFHTSLLSDKLVETQEEYEEALARAPFGSHAATVAAMYPASAFGSPRAALAEVTGDAFFVCPTRRAARAYAAAGLDTFLYTFNREPEVVYLPDLGVFHSAEVSFVFGNDGQMGKIGETDLPLVALMTHYWTNFARAGNPNSTTTDIEWPQYSLASDEHIVLALPITTGQEHKKEICDFWDGIEIP